MEQSYHKDLDLHGIILIFRFASQVDIGLNYIKLKRLKYEVKMKNLNRVFLVVLFVGLIQSCSSTKLTEVKTVDVGGSWIYEPQKGCMNSQICASGEGQNHEEADVNAKKSLAGIFETKINAKFQYTKQSIDDAQINEIKESIVDQVSAQVDQILKGVKIIKRYEKNGLQFSLAALDKVSSGRVLRQEITKLDDEISHFFKLKSRIYIKKLTLLFNKREILNEKLTLINSHGIPRKVSFSNIKALKYDSKSAAKILISMDESVPKTLAIKIQTALTDIGYKFVKKESMDYELRGSYKANEEYLNVKGFKKYTFEYFLETLNANGKKIGGVNLSYTANGRTENNAFLKIRKKLLSDIDSNLDKLNLDMR